MLLLSIICIKIQQIGKKSSIIVFHLFMVAKFIQSCILFRLFKVRAHSLPRIFRQKSSLTSLFSKHRMLPLKFMLIT